MIDFIAFLVAIDCTYIESARFCPLLSFWIISKTIRLLLVLLELFYAFAVFSVLSLCSL